jgi:hypothetical protein
MLEAFLVTLAICGAGYADSSGQGRVIRIPTSIQNTEYDVTINRLRAFAPPGSNEGHVEKLFLT